MTTTGKILVCSECGSQQVLYGDDLTCCPFCGSKDVQIKTEDIPERGEDLRRAMSDDTA